MNEIVHEIMSKTRVRQRESDLTMKRKKKLHLCVLDCLDNYFRADSQEISRKAGTQIRPGDVNGNLVHGSMRWSSDLCGEKITGPMRKMTFAQITRDHDNNMITTSFRIQKKSKIISPYTERDWHLGGVVRTSESRLVPQGVLVIGRPVLEFNASTSMLQTQWSYIRTHGPCFSGNNKRNLVVTSAVGNRGTPRCRDMKSSAGSIMGQCAYRLLFVQLTKGMVLPDRGESNHNTQLAPRMSLGCMRCVHLPCHCIAKKMQARSGNTVYDRETCSYRVETLRWPIKLL